MQSTSKPQGPRWIGNSETSADMCRIGKANNIACWIDGEAARIMPTPVEDSTTWSRTLGLHTHPFDQKQWQSDDALAS